MRLETVRDGKFCVNLLHLTAEEVRKSESDVCWTVHHCDN